MKQTTQVKIFGAIVFYFLVLNLFYHNGIIDRSLDIFWDESTGELMSDFRIINLHHFIFVNFPSNDLFILRVPGVLILMLTCWAIFSLGKKIFGTQTISYTLLILISSFLIPLSGKFATADVWLFSAQTISAILLILFLKQPTRKWHISHTVVVLFGVLLEPISMISFTAILWILLYIFHPKGKNLIHCWGFLLTFLIALSCYLGGIFSFDFQDTSVFHLHFANVSILKYLAIIFTGMLPWLIFFPSGIWNMIKRLRKKEELAIITVAWLAASIFSFSLATQAIFALIISKQVIGFFDKNYPYENWIKITSLLHLGLALFGAIYWMLIWWEIYQGDGFRAAMFTSFVYWSGCLIAFLGLYGKNRKSILVGLSMAGLFATYLFWSQIFPLIN